MASVKRKPPAIDGPEPKKSKVAESNASGPPEDANFTVSLNPADCSIDFNIEGNGLQGSARHEEGFAYCWSGARANVGITGGKYCFGCKIISAQKVDMKDTPLEQQHVCRIGVSRGDDAVGNLGETAHSFGFGGTGKFSNSGKFSDYGENFGVGDAIICAVNLENEDMASVGFSKNGKWLGIAKHFDAGSKGLAVGNSPNRMNQWESALFPHVLLKNVIVQLQFSIDDGLVPEEGYKPWASAIEDGNSILGPTFSKTDCEVMMMIGLPASGKTTWAEKWVKDHPEKRYVLLGTNLALDQMKVPGLLRKNNYGERFEQLMDRATGIFNTLLSRASKIPRNFIIDQTNVYKSARKRKLKPFADYKKIAVVVFPRPEELKIRAAKRFKEMGKEVPAEAVNTMLANFTLPTSKEMPGTDEHFDEVWYVELNRVESQRHLEEMKRDMNAKPDISPYSRGSSVQSYHPSLQHRPEAPVLSHGGFSFQAQSPATGAGVNWNGSYSQPPPGISYGPYNSSHSVHDWRCDFNPSGNYGGGVDERDHGGGNAYSFAGAESKSFIPQAPADLRRGHNVDRRFETSLSAYHSSDGYATRSQFPPPYSSAAGQPVHQFSTPSINGSPLTLNPMPAPPYGNTPTDMHHSGVQPPPRLPAPRGNFPHGIGSFGVYPPHRPGPGYY